MPKYITNTKTHKMQQENVHLLSNGHFQCITYARHYLNSSKEKKVKSTKIIVGYNDITFSLTQTPMEKTHKCLKEYKMSGQCEKEGRSTQLWKLGSRWMAGVQVLYD